MFHRPLLAIGFLLSGFGIIELAFGVAGLIVHGQSASGFFFGGVISLIVGGGMAGAFRHAAQSGDVDPRSAFLLTAGSWLAAPVSAALPLYFSELNLSLTDAVFETVSGLTTTGSTVLTGLDSMDPALLLWRSVLQWIGGVGIILMAIIILPFLRVGGMQLFEIESSAATEGWSIARAGSLIRSIATLYLALTILCAASYSLAGMNAFDAVNHAMTTLATGGYSTHDASLGFFTQPAVHWVAVVFMIAGALPFMAYLRTVSGRADAFVRDPQAPVFAGFMLCLCLFAAAFLAQTPDGYFDALRRVAVNIISVTTTTGYATEEYQLWGPGFVGLFFALTFVGGCAGSTSGAVKIYRFQLLRIFAAEHLRRLFSPSIVVVHSYGGVRLTRDIAFSVLAFLSLFVGAFSLGGLVLTFTGLDLVTALSASATALCNVGPGLGDIIGPAGNFAALPDMAKWTLTVLMLLGRLELFALLVLFDPYFWR